MNQKKIRKLMRDPKLFFKDMLHKRLPKKSSVAPTLVKKKGNYSYSVVAAVYGVEKYLDDFFKSLVNQSLDFKNHIQIVMVDDGSPDSSAEIIRKWQKKYPENILYVKKENGGQASARNLGLDYATGEWISFIDPDDFVNADYFYAIDNHISRNKNDLLFIGCNFIFYHEDKNQFSDTHPLKFRFQKESTIKISDEVTFYQLSASTAVFNARKIFDYSVRFNENIKPSFEDGEFIARLSLLAKGEYISFLPSAKYFYRKRSDGTSTLDRSALDPRRYGELLDLAHLSLLSFCENNGKVAPMWLQSTLLYEIFWNLRSVMQHGHQFEFMTDDFKAAYLERLRRIFSYIDDKVILQYSLAGCWFYHKVGILGLLKNTSPDFSITYIDTWDVAGNLLCIRYFWHGEPPLETIEVSGKEIVPSIVKSMHHDFLGHEFVCERRIWVRIPATPEVFTVKLNEKQSIISLKGKQFKAGIKCVDIIDGLKTTAIDPKKINVLAKNLRHQAFTLENKKKFNKAWVFMDRDTMADDNAEHLYRFVFNQHPEINAIFVLRKNSPDWSRLSNEGFKLVDFDSEEHHIALLNADFLLSSHVDAYVVNKLPEKEYGDLLKYKYIFLQHGVTKDDLSKWLNTKNISLFVTATGDEFDSIVHNGSKYKFGYHQVGLTGFPRHDGLLNINNQKIHSHKKRIVIMPTWRNNLMGKNIGSGFQRSFNDEFFDSLYAKSWKDLLHSDQLRLLSERFEAELIFYPHANIDIYIDGLDIPKYISIKRNGDGESMQKTFVETDVLITDYSSVAFEVAYLQKPVIYYQFDRDQIFAGDHTYEKGYFDYETNGFGPVCLQLEEVISGLEQYLLHPQGEVWAHYKAIAENTFPFRDGRCCERTFNAVKGLQLPVTMSKEEQIEKLRYGASNALKKNFIHTAINRYRQCFEMSWEEQDAKNLVSLLSKDKRHGEVLKLYETYGQRWSEETVVHCLPALVALGCFKYVEEVLERKFEFEVLSDFSESIVEYCAWKKDLQLYTSVVQEFTVCKSEVAEIFNSYLERDWEAVRAKLRFASPEILRKHFGLFLQSCFRTGNTDYAKDVFTNLIEGFDPVSRKIYTTRIQLASGDFDAALKSYDNLCKINVESMCSEDVDNWLKIRKYKNIKSSISDNIGMELLRRFSIDSDISCHLIQQTEFVKNGYFYPVFEIFTKDDENISSEISLFLFKNLIALHKFQEAESFVENASFAALEEGDRVLIKDFQKINSENFDMI